MIPAQNPAEPASAPFTAPGPPRQADVDAEVAALHAAYAEARAAGAPAAHHPPRDWRPYRSSALRHPQQPPVAVQGDPDTVELHTPVFGPSDVTATDNDLTVQHAGAPLGERITVSGRLLDSRGRPVRGQLVELWQANASGRYAHLGDQHPAPLDPHFSGFGRTLTGDDGSWSFTTIKPGAYPWRNHENAWRPAHLHFSVFGHAFTQRLVTQMYFPGDPLLRHDPILQAVPDAPARERLVAAYDHGLSEPEWSLGYRWDIVLDGPAATPTESEGRP